MLCPFVHLSCLNLSEALNLHLSGSDLQAILSHLHLSLSQLSLGSFLASSALYLQTLSIFHRSNGA